MREDDLGNQAIGDSIEADIVYKFDGKTMAIAVFRFEKPV